MTTYAENRADRTGAADGRAGAFALGAYAARSCAVKTQNAFNRTIPLQTREVDDRLAELFEGGQQFEEAVIARLVRSFSAASSGRVIDLRLADELPAHIQSGACAEAVAAGADLIIGGLLPRDVRHHRSGRADVLVRGEDRPDGRPGYHVIDIKNHRIHERKKPTTIPRPNSSVLVSRFSTPAPVHADGVSGYGFRLTSREADLLQLAHYHRMLEDLGWDAPGRPLAGLVGTDDWMISARMLDAGMSDARMIDGRMIDGGDLITWMDLAEPLLRTFSRSDDSGWTSRSALERYDHEHAFRVDVAAIARRMTGAPDDPAPLVQPIVVDECPGCQWWDYCRSRLSDDDVSLRIGKGSLDVREIATLRAHGISTVDQLAGVDLDELFTWYLPEVTHRAGAEDRLRQAARRAKLITTGVDFERITTDPIEVPGADLEIDFDIETTAEGAIYLWGFRTHRSGSTSGRYHPFADFSEIDGAAERRLAVRALTWLRHQAAGPDSVRVYHYSGFEIAALRRLADSYPDEPVFAWALEFAAESFCDLLPLVKQNFFGVNGVGLKPVATAAAGFSWRDDDAGGLNSTRWFVDAVHDDSAEQRELARTRVLNYNEDDVIATARVRAWLRAS